MQIEQQVRELRLRQHVALDPAERTDEEGLHRRIPPDQFPRDREARVEMSAGPASGEDDPHAGTAIGSVADPPITFSRLLPMFTRMPVKSNVSTRLERP